MEVDTPASGSAVQEEFSPELLRFFYGKFLWWVMYIIIMQVYERVMQQTHVTNFSPYTHITHTQLVYSLTLQCSSGCLMVMVSKSSHHHHQHHLPILTRSLLIPNTDPDVDAPHIIKDFFGRREFSFTINDDIYIRYQSFRDQAEMEAAIQKKQPHKIDIGAVFTAPVSIPAPPPPPHCSSSASS